MQLCKSCRCFKAFLFLLLSLDKSNCLTHCSEGRSNCTKQIEETELTGFGLYKNVLNVIIVQKVNKVECKATRTPVRSGAKEEY
jgi:hypothetical protein